MKILIIEDNSDLRALFALAFGSAGFEVLEAKDGETGKKLAYSRGVDVILLDIMMPHIDGFQVLKDLKKEVQLNAPIIVTSNLSEDYTQHQALEGGADAYLRKVDYTPQEVVEKVLKIMESKGLDVPEV